MKTDTTFTPPPVQPQDEQLARRAARILGERSAAADALRKLDEYRKSGRTAVIVRNGHTWLVIGEPAKPTP